MGSSGLAFIRRVPELASLLEHADHVDVKTVIGSVDLRTFLANMFCYQPNWVTALYRVRAIFVRFLGMCQHGLPPRHARWSLTPETFPTQVGQALAFFTVRMAKEEQYWIAEARETHLSALLGVIVEPLPGQPLKRFHVMTIVSYISQLDWSCLFYDHSPIPSSRRRAYGAGRCTPITLSTHEKIGGPEGIGRVAISKGRPLWLVLS